MRRSKRIRWLGAIVAVVVLLTLIAAPNSSHLNQGSSYSRAPDGYGAWYAFMQQRGANIHRWQKPLSDLPTDKPITLLRVSSELRSPILQKSEQDWVQQGNTLIVLGVQERVSEATFSTMLSISVGRIKIDTRRRHQGASGLLGDRFGTIVWVRQLERGQVIFSTTANLAANAYQDYPGNYTYLAELVSQGNNSIWIDEYIHGYKDSNLKLNETAKNWVAYLARTPLLPTLLQASILLLVAIWAKNQRFGVAQGLDLPIVDNSEAYIQALALVLQKAESTEFILDVVGKEEQLQLQKALGLGQLPVNQRTLVNAWVQYSKSSAAELEDLLQLQSQKRRVRESELLSWLKKWQAVYRKGSGEL